MTRRVEACDYHDILVNALRRMIFADVSRLFVYRESPQQIVGVFSLSDATRFRSGTCRACVSSRIRPR
jgi:CBS domain containing-hemolysin-like protein